MNATIDRPDGAELDGAGAARSARARAGEDRLLTMPLMTVGGREHSARVQVPVPGLKRLRLGEAVPAGHRVIRVPTAEAGDERYSWNASDFDQIREAKRFFNEMVAKGMVPFAVGPRGVKGEAMRVFDPTAEEIIFAPINVPRAVVGG
jgi:hypothetical protein